MLNIIIRKMQIKTMKGNYTSTRMGTIKEKDWSHTHNCFLLVTMWADDECVNLIVVIISQYTHISNHHCVHLECVVNCSVVPTLWPHALYPPGSSVHGILQARMLEWGAMPSSRGSSWPRDQTCASRISCIGRWVVYHCANWEALCTV